MKGTFPIALALIAGAAPLPVADLALAQTQERVRRVVIFGNDPCPRGADGEIVICARRPDTERYRIPEEFRDDATAEDPESQSWAVKAQALEYLGETGIQSCSTVGPGGVTGCWEQIMRQAREERAAAARTNQPRR